jgi:hypothetical protein
MQGASTGVTASLSVRVPGARGYRRFEAASGGTFDTAARKAGARAGMPSWSLVVWMCRAKDEPGLSVGGDAVSERVLQSLCHHR